METIKQKIAYLKYLFIIMQHISENNHNVQCTELGTYGPRNTRHYTKTLYSGAQRGANGKSKLPCTNISPSIRNGILLIKKAATLMYYCTTLFVLLIVLGILFAVFLPNIFAQAAAVIVTTLCASIVAVSAEARNYYGAATLHHHHHYRGDCRALVKIGRDAYAGYTTSCIS